MTFSNNEIEITVSDSQEEREKKLLEDFEKEVAETFMKFSPEIRRKLIN